MACNHPPRQWHLGHALLPCANPNCDDGVAGLSLIVPGFRAADGLRPVQRYRYEREYTATPYGRNYFWTGPIRE